MGRADVYLQPDAPDPVLDADVVAALARRHIRGPGAVTQVDESGGEARAYLFDRVVVKTQRPHRLRPRTSLAKEADLLSHLAAAGLGDPIPHLFGYDTVEVPGAGAVEYLCMSRIPGRAVIAATPPTATRAGMLAELAAVLRAVHGAATPPLLAGGLYPFDDDSALRWRVELWFADLADIANQAPMPIGLPELTAAAVAVLPDSLAPLAVLHSNPGPTHTFTDPATGRFTGVIDFGDSYLSHPALDLRSWPDPADRIALYDAYCDGVPDDPGFDHVWTAAMLYADAAAVLKRTPYAEAAAVDLTVRLRHL